MYSCLFKHVGLIFFCGTQNVGVFFCVCPYNESQWGSVLFCTPLTSIIWTKTVLQNFFFKDL